MPEPKDIAVTPRLAVSLSADDNKLIIAIHAELQKQEAKRLSYSEVVRRGLRCLADKLKIEVA